MEQRRREEGEGPVPLAGIQEGDEAEAEASLEQAQNETKAALEKLAATAEGSSVGEQPEVLEPEPETEPDAAR